MVASTVSCDALLWRISATCLFNSDNFPCNSAEIENNTCFHKEVNKKLITGIIEGNGMPDPKAF